MAFEVAMATIASEFKNSTNKISVSIRKLVYEETETFVGRVSRNTVNIDNLITEICEKNPAYNEYELKKFAKDLKTGILSNLSNAKSVNLLDLGTLYIALSGGMKIAPKTASEISSLTVKFSPSKTLTESVGKLEIDKIVYADSAPLISSIKCLWDGIEEKAVKPGKLVSITGDRLKLEGTECGLYFCPVAEDGSAETDEAKWLKCVVTRNLPKTLEAYVPDNLTAGEKYALAIKTRPLADGTYSVGFSETLKVAE